MKHYTRLRFAEREEISRQVAVGHHVRLIARQIGRSPSTILRELRHSRNGRVTHRAEEAHQSAAAALHRRGRPRRLMTNNCLRAYVHAGLAKRWSPEQIAKRLHAEYPDDPFDARIA